MDVLDCHLNMWEKSQHSYCSCMENFQFSSYRDKTSIDFQLERKTMKSWCMWPNTKLKQYLKKKKSIIVLSNPQILGTKLQCPPLLFL